MRMDVGQPGMFGKWANIPITLDAGKPLMKGVGRSLLNDFCCSRSAIGGNYGSDWSYLAGKSGVSNLRDGGKKESSGQNAVPNRFEPDLKILQRKIRFDRLDLASISIHSDSVGIPGNLLQCIFTHTFKKARIRQPEFVENLDFRGSQRLLPASFCRSE